ncbi:hypothetical protein AAG906_005828 [Vitis piasezkii]
MAESVITIATTIAEKIAGYLVAPIGRRLSYLFCYRSHMDDLNNKVQELGLVRGDLQITVDEAIRRGDEIRPIVEDWLTRADENTGEAKTFMEDEKKRTKSCFYGWCPNLKSRYQLGREADKKAQVIVEIQQHRNFPDGVSYRVPPRNVTFKNYEPFKSRASTVNQVMDALRDDKIDKIGVWGMGGVGKSTLVKQVAQLAEDEKLFTAGVYIDGKDESTRAVELKQRLQKEKILIILDDIWKLVCLEEVGIPSKDDQKGCKIVLASRNEDLLRKDMGARVCFPLQHLPKEEAWHLFKKTAGDSVEGDKLRPIAIEVVNECEGLPIAIVTIAKALKDESVAVWENALDELRSAAPTNISGVDDKVYGCLKWSYNHLKGDEVKSLFLLCGWLSYGDISMHQLLQYAMGLGLFDHKSLEQARNKLVTLLRILKASSLLLDGEDHRYDFGGASRLLFMDADNKSVRMHDVVRDVARNIASKDPHRFVVREDGEELSETNGSKYISLNCKDVHELPHRLVCPKLQFLLLQNGMNLLKVLDLSEMHFTTLPSTLHSLPNLRTLRLDRCKLGDIALIGELKKLQVLSMVGSDIQQLPSEMGQLTNLRLLDLNDCKFQSWKTNYKTSKTLRLRQVDRSSLLRDGIDKLLKKTEELCLSKLEEGFEIKEVDHVGTNLQLLPKLRYLGLHNLLELMNFDYFSSDLETTSQGMCSQGNLDIHMPFLVSFPNLEKLEFTHLPKLKEIWHHQPSLESFYNLEILKVFYCSCLVNLVPSYLIQRFDNLKKINVYDCKVLEYTFDLQGLDENVEILPKLETLELQILPRLRYIICNEDKNDGMRCLFSSSTLMDFQNLKCLSIQDCAYENNEEGHVNTPIEDIVLFGGKVSFPNLEELKLVDLPKLKMIWHHQLSLEFFCKLRILSVHNCPRLVNLVPSHLIQSFQNLKEVNVYDCKALESVFDYQGFNGDGGILSKIEILTLKKLPRLRLIICNEDKNDNMSYLLSPSKFKDFYQLKELHIIDCGMLLDEELKILRLKKLPRLRYAFASQFKNFHNLKELHIIDCGMEDGVMSILLASFLESRASTVNKIMDALRDDNINLIRVWGTAGVGKTTLLKQVAQQAKQQQLFTKQAYMDVSWTRDSDKLQEGVAELQQKIAKVLGFPLRLRDESGIADELKRRLMMQGKILIILDDIWTEVDLVKVGIPFEGDETQCKMVLASRDGDVLCKDMAAQICFQVEPLPPEEAWSFFKKTSGDSVEEDLELRPIAIQVVEECEGLPIAIVTIAKALKDETVAVWKNALEQLRSCSPTNIRAVDKKVYSCLEWSYTHLKGDDVKSLFLLCGMLGYGDISLDLLFQYCMGLDLFDHMEPLEQATNKLVTLVEILKASGLLLDSHKDRHNFDEERDNKFVRMHGVVREVARAIASKDPHPFVVREDVGLGEWSETDESKRCTFISLNCRAVHELPLGLVCPELQFFLLHNKNPSLNIPNSFFEAMKKLKVLDLPKMCFTTLPSSFDSLANLHTLRLNQCNLVDIALIGKLTKLQVLSLVGSTIQQLPNEMVQLTNLRLLNLNDCKELEVIPRNILSSLSRLECLYMTSSFTQWAVEGESNACLSELNHLSYLTTLDIDIPDANLLPKGTLFENLTRYAIFVGNFQGYKRYCRTKRVLKLRKSIEAYIWGMELAS